jgi:hypothetical protein
MVMQYHSKETHRVPVCALKMWLEKFSADMYGRK